MDNPERSVGAGLPRAHAALEPEPSAQAAADTRLTAALVGSSANPALEFFCSMLDHAGLSEALDPAVQRPDLFAAYAELRLKICEAMLARDAELALVLQKRSCAQVTAWLNADVETGKAQMARR